MSSNKFYITSVIIQEDNTVYTELLAGWHPSESDATVEGLRIARDKHGRGNFVRDYRTFDITEIVRNEPRRLDE